MLSLSGAAVAARAPQFGSLRLSSEVSQQQDVFLALGEFRRENADLLSGLEALNQDLFVHMVPVPVDEATFSDGEITERPQQLVFQLIPRGGTLPADPSKGLFEPVPVTEKTARAFQDAAIHLIRQLSSVAWRLAARSIKLPDIDPSKPFSIPVSE